jgi:uncharacterized protein YqjF (DUF2071 family)
VSGDFNYSILSETSHRPWAMPSSPWVMTQTWHHLLFAHWRVDPEAIRGLVPEALPLDVHDGDAWVGVVPFQMTNVAPRGLPNIPFVSSFPELNVRTYVTVEGRPGVYFFSLDAGSTIAVTAARTMFGLPYFRATMDVDVSGDEVRYVSVREPAEGLAEFTASYRPIAPPQPPIEGTLEYFLTERYCLYTVDETSGVQRLDIHHPPWPLQAAAATIERNTMAQAAGITVAGAPLLHYARRQDMVAWLPQSL